MLAISTWDAVSALEEHLSLQGDKSLPEASGAAQVDSLIPPKDSNLFTH